MSAKLENHNKRILVVDDDPAASKLVRKALEWEGYPVEVAENGEKALAMMSDWNPHLVLLDMSMPGLNGMDTLKFLRDSKEYVSVIFVSGNSLTEDVIRGLDAGADDYVTKPFDTLELLARVRAQLRNKVLNDELSKANGKLRELVDIDDLTGLYNMRSLYKRLDHEIERAQRYERAVCVVMMDMDNFKTVNDQADHLFGSYVLSEVGDIIRNNVRKVDFAARYGGDEFLIVLTEINLAGAKVFADRLLKVIEGYDFNSDGHSMRLTSSLGFAITSPALSRIDARSLVRYADRALYDAKEGGKNCVKYYDLDENAQEELLSPNKVAQLGRRS